MCDKNLKRSIIWFVDVVFSYPLVVSLINETSTMLYPVMKADAKNLGPSII